MLKVFCFLVIYSYFIGVSHTNSFNVPNKLTEEEFKRSILGMDRYGYICINDHHKDDLKVKSKALEYPYPYMLDNTELKQLFREKLNRDVSNLVCDWTITDPSQSKFYSGFHSTDIALDTDYIKNVYVTFVVFYHIYGSYDNSLSERSIVSDTLLIKEMPLHLTQADYSKIYTQLIKAIVDAGNDADFKVQNGAYFKQFYIHVSKSNNGGRIEDIRKYLKQTKLISSWKPEFASQPKQAIQSVNTAVEKTTEKPQDKTSSPKTAPNKSEAVQKAEQEKIIKAEIKKEVAVAQVENKAQLTQDKALPVVKKVDDDVQKALKKIPKKEKKKVELKPYLETVVVCTPPNERGSFKCYGPNGSFSGHPNQPKGYKTPEEVVTMNMKWSCPDQKRFASVNNHSIWGCGQGATGSVSSKDSSQGLPIPERATYYCKPKQIGCKNQSPTQAEN